jgi:DNA-binding MarR family transcriptional regulator
MSRDATRAPLAEIATGLRVFSARLLVHSLLASEALGLSAMDLVCMCLLQLHGSVTPGWLAERTGLTASAITGVVDRLERAGYVNRSADPTDRRRVIVAPDLPRFTSDLDEHTPRRSPVALDFLSGYSTGQLRTVDRFFTDLAAASSSPGSLSRSTGEK